MLFKAASGANPRSRRQANSSESTAARVQPNYSQVQNELVIFNYADNKRELVLTCDNYTKPATAQTELVVTTRADLDTVDSALKCKRERFLPSSAW